MASEAREPESKFAQELHSLLKEKQVMTSDPEKLVKYLISMGVFCFDDLKDLTIDDLEEENTGLKPIQQRKLLRVAKDYCGSDVPSESLSATNYCVPVKYDRFGQGEIVDSMSCQSVTTSVRYIMCQDLFVKEAKEKVVIQLYLNVTTIRDLVVRICANEGIQLDSYTLELFTQEGYPININNYNEDCPLIKWGFKDSSLVYVFKRRIKQTGIAKNIQDDSKTLDSTQGTHTLLIHSVLYGSFSVVSDIKKDTGEIIKQRIFSAKGLPPSSFKISTRPKNHDFASECIDEWPNENIQSLFEDPSSGDNESHVVELMLTTSPLYICKGGVTYCFGKCTYYPMVEQTDEGYSKFYSILYLLVNNGFKGCKSKILSFIHREYSLPPLTYALKVLFTENSLEQFPLWVALVEGLFQLFAAILKDGYEVPEKKVFECSDYLWGMIIMQSDKLQDSECLKWTSTSLLCKLSNLKMVDPVTLPRCSDVFEAQVILQRIKSGTAVPNCDVRDLTQGKIKRADKIERLLMLSDFHNCDTLITWEGYSNMISSIEPLELPTDVTWEYLYQAKDKFKVTDPSSPNNLAYYKGKLVVIVKVIKDGTLSREIYDPLYDPKENHGNAVANKSLLTTSGSNEMDLKKHAKASIRTTFAASIRQCLKKGNDSSISPATTAIKKEPREAVVVVLDCSSSMSNPIFDDSTKNGEHLDRLTAAKQLLKSFLNRTEGFQYHHAVGLVSCSSQPRIEIPLTDDYDLFENIIEMLKPGGGTALYDSMVKASEMLLSIKTEYPGCKRRILCLTDGEDLHSKMKIDACFKTLKQGEILLDSVLIIGPKGNIDQKSITHGTGGFCFHPQSMKEALKIFETETILSSAVRMIRQEPLQSSLSVYKDLAKYPYNATAFYGQQDLRTQFAHELSKENYSNPARIVQHNSLFGQQTRTITSRNQRILQEIQHYLRNPHPSIDVYPQEENISRWKIVLLGPEHTPYEGGTFILYAKFPETYPEKPPEIRFETPIYHCNINSNGRICHSSLDTKYVPRVKVKTLLEYIYGLLMSPEPLDPLDSVLALELNTNRVEYERRARELVEKFAKGADRAVLRKEIVSDDGDAPSSMICPLTGKLYLDPVNTEHGRTYERKALMEYLSENNNMDPLVRKPVSVDKITPNLNLKEIIEVYRKRSK